MRKKDFRPVGRNLDLEVPCAKRILLSAINFWKDCDTVPINEL